MQLFDKVVICEGYPNTLSREVGCKSVNIPLKAIQRDYEVKGEIDKSLLYVYINPMLFGYGFAWAAPFEDNKIVIGCASNRGDIISLHRVATLFFVKALNIELRNPIGGFYGGFVLMGYPIKFFDGNVFCIGDSVSMVKSVSGGGLYAISYYTKAISELILLEESKDRLKKDSLSRELAKQFYLKKFVWRLLRSTFVKDLISKILDRKRIEIGISNIENFDHHINILLDVIVTEARRITSKIT